MSLWKTKTVPVDGFCKDGFTGILDSFKKNFSEGWEAEGAAFAVYKDGELVVDIWGGYAEKKYGRRWNQDTLTTVFSTSKSIAAICFSMLVESGACAYEDAVSRYWPAYAQKGKEDTTIAQIMAHQSGVPCLAKTLDLETLLDPVRLDIILEEEATRFPPGSKTAYQPFTYGWLVDGLFRRIDRKQRSVQQFYDQEIRDRHHIDMYIGGTQAEEHRIARLKQFTTPSMIRECGFDMSVARNGISCMRPGSFFMNGLRNMELFGKDFTMFNNPDLRLLGQPAVNGVATARGLAKVHQVFLEGHLIGPQLFERFKTPSNPDRLDETLGEVLNKGYGWMYWRGPKGNWQFGHSGVGGQNVRIDAQHGLVYAYVCNGLKAGSGNHCFTFRRLEKKLFDCIDEAAGRKV
ncbi:unnamed protein product, partial [Mesorhabditis spiculigera]